MGSIKTPLLENGGEEEIKKKGWGEVVDMEEAKMQVCFAVPMILTNVSYYCITLISVMFAGHIGDLELAASTLANSWAVVTGFALMTGLSGSLETLCGQGYGARLYRMMGIYLQSSIIIAFFFSVMVSALWFYSEPILILLHQEPQVSKMAAIYMKHLIPGLFAYGFLQCILRFLQTQTVIIPLVVCSVVPLAIHVGITYTLVVLTPLGFRGAPLAATISLWISFLMLALYVNYADKFKHTWEGFLMESFHYVLPSLKLAVPSAVMVCVNTEAVIFNITYGFSAAVSTRVSNELGAGNTDRAKNSITVTFKLSIILALTVILALAFGHDIWASCFTNSSIIKREFASMTPLLAFSILFDSAQGILSGVSRGCGWQHLAAWTNLATFYGVGMPIAVLLGFKTGLHAKGLWIGLICGLFCQSCSLLVITVRTKWEKINLFVENGNAQSVLV
ncbi:protein DETOXIFICATION 18-like isoform X2 [Telopea speciosissima]|uniref:protein DETOXIFICATION 18-like isoform X2 n=1 Tax=Telopea speciosissima TaxID=54955 RepID=UPI001CC63854|nr:protein DETOXIFICATION 18-like isoform X2 [Telopea speciosissima]